jgi:hypothetical protein
MLQPGPVLLPLAAQASCPAKDFGYHLFMSGPISVPDELH